MSFAHVSWLDISSSPRTTGRREMKALFLSLFLPPYQSQLEKKKRKKNSESTSSPEINDNPSE
jgi:hypothetical protein